MPSRTRMSHQSMPSLRPFNHNPPSEIGASLRLKSVLYDLVGGFFGSSIMSTLPSSQRSSERPAACFFGRRLLALADDFSSLVEPSLIAGHLFPDDNRNAES